MVPTPWFVRRAAPALLAFAFAVGAAAPASATGPGPLKPRPTPLDCKAAAAEFGAANIWWGQFSGRRETLFNFFNTTSQRACFRTAVDCKNWLYWMNSDWPDWQWVSRCDKGFTP